ncbi:MAG TPA: 4-alpha-glucanotransferase [Bryobacteraceae bacterium]|jgi:4-alpha-glucanotransferase|nr:4-alpha-glucanotransferase [Bryobacteraceae bacterium]
MRFPRSSGILLHPTSLPGPNGIGELGPQAYAFVDFLERAGQKIWQVLPLGPTGYGDSPYASFSAFAGNHLLISLDRLVAAGYLSQDDLKDRPEFPNNRVDYGWVIHWKIPLLAKAAARFLEARTKSTEYERWIDQNAWWLDDYARFMTAKLPYPEDVHRFWQFEFFREWMELKAEANRRGIRIMGDMPIYVASDSADVASHPELFRTDVVAGVPPDYFSATGQLWGNPIYRWDVMKEQGYEWWIQRFRHTLTLFDMVRLDHFRGFEAYWQVPASEKTAVHGEWVKGPGAELFDAVETALGSLPIVAENLGVITDEVEAIRHRFCYPGMSVLQFAFGNDPQAPTFRPHNYPRELVAYTGTHDNDTTVGWWTSTGETDSTRSAEEIVRERNFTRRYLRTDGSEINWVFIQTIMASVADTVLIPLQDVLGLGSEARMNLPGRAHGNWQWRLREGDLTVAIAERLEELTTMYDR